MSALWARAHADLQVLKIDDWDKGKFGIRRKVVEKKTGALRYRIDGSHLSDCNTFIRYIPL